MLCHDVNRLGWLGDVLDVNEGYARNYLLPQGLAVVPTEANLKSLAKEAAKRAGARKHEKQRLEEAAAAADGAEAVVAAKANEQGSLFGSIGAREIADNLREQGFEVADEFVQLPENIKQVGTFPGVVLKFSNDITAAVTVVVVPKQDNDLKTGDA